MDTKLSNHSNQKYGRFLSLIGETDLFFREMIIAFYGLYMVFFLAFNVRDEQRIIVLAYRAVSAVCYPGILFAAGWLIAGLCAGQSRGNRRSVLLGLSAVCYIFYVIIGAALHVLAYGEECLKTIKNILFAILIPGSGGVFLTCALLFLIFGLFGESLMAVPGDRRIRIGLCAAGLLTTFIPQGLIGYGLFGILIGGDVAGAVPLSFYLTAFLAGMHCREKATEHNKAISLKSKENLIVLLLLFAFGAFFFLTGMKQAAMVLLGTGASFIAVWILQLLKPVYSFLENVFLKIFLPVHAFYRRERDRAVPGTKRYYVWYYLFYSVLFALITFFIFVPYINGGYSLIWESDGLGQYVPKAYRFVKDMPGVISSLLSGNMNFKQYDFSVGLGAPMAYSFDPVYWLYLIAGQNHIEWMYNFAVILRYFLAGAAMSCLILYLRKSWRMAAVGSFAYIYSGYAIFAGTRHSQFITPLILFPLIVVAMERLIRDRKWYLMTVLVAVSLFCSYYFLYMNTIAIGIYFVLRILLTKEYRNVRTFFERGLIITGSYLLGTSIAFISLVSSFGGYLGSSRSGGSAVASLITNNTLFYRSEWLIDIAAALVAVDFGPGQWLRIGMVPVVLFTLILLFTRKNKPELRFSFLICLVFCIFPIFGYIMSGFSSVTNRWAYIFTAVIALVLALNLDRLMNLSKKEIRLFTGIAGGYGLLMLIGLKYHTTAIQGSLAILGLTLAIILWLNSEKTAIRLRTRRLFLFWFIMFAVFMQGNFFVTRVGTDTGGSHLETYVPAGKADSYLRATALKHLNKVKGYDKNGFVRSDNIRNTSLTRNSAMVVPYNSVSTFTSTLAGGIVDYNRQMGNNAWNIVTVYDYNFRTIPDELASVRYLGKEAYSKTPLPYGYHKVFETESPTSMYEIYENKYALPVGYCYDKVIPSGKAESLDALSKQELTMTTAIVDDKDIKETGTIGQIDSQSLKPSDEPDALITTKDIPIKDIKVTSGMTYDKDGLVTVTDPENAVMSFRFESLPKSETCLVIKGEVEAEDDSREIEINTQCRAKGLNYSGRFRLDNYSTGQKEYVYNLGYHKDVIKNCSLTFESEGLLRVESFRICSLPMNSYSKRAEALRAEALTDVVQKTNELSGKISLTKDKLLAVSLPYQGGWTAYVDGKKAKIIKVNYQYMGLPLPKGDHDIRLVYRMPGLRTGLMISLAGMVLFLLIIIGNAVRKRRA